MSKLIKGFLELVAQGLQGLIRKGIGQQLRYLRRNLGHLGRLVDAGASLSPMSLT